MASVWDRGASITERDARGLFVNAFITKARDLNYKDLCNVVDSTRRQELYAALGTVPQMEEVKSERSFAGYEEYTFTVDNVEYQAGIKVQRRLVEEDQTGQTRTILGSLGARVANHPDKLMYAVMAAGESTTGFDGFMFFATNHVLGTESAQSNLIAGTLTAAEISADAIDTSAKAFQSDFRLAVETMENMQDDRGEPYYEDGVKAEDLIIVVPSALKFIAKAALGVRFLDATSNIMEGECKKIISVPSAYLASRCDWYLYNIGQPVRPFIHQRFRPKRKSELIDTLKAKYSEDVLAQLETVMIESVWRNGDQVDSHTLKTGEYLLGARALYATTVGDFRTAVKVNNTE